MKQPTAIDLFSGCGGLTQGLKLAGFRVVAAIEREKLAATTYKANHPRVAVRNADIRTVPARTLMRELGLEPGDLDLLAGCPPCQGFSALRTRNGSAIVRDRRNKLISQVLRFARAFRPKSIMLENVPGLAERRPFRRLCRDLRKIGYRIDWDVKDACNYGVPQRRKRLILIAGRGFDIRLAKESNTLRTVRQAIGRLPKAGQSRDPLHNISENRSPRIVELIRAIPKDGGSRSSLGKSRQLQCHKKIDGFSDIYGRMKWDAPAPTITGGCFNPSKGRFLHPRDNRAITLREAALLQSFPARYRFPADAGKETVALMIGNALPPKFVQRHAKRVVKALRAREKAVKA